MKKFYVLGMVLMGAACFAFAASLSVPWFVDDGNIPGKLPPVAGKGQVGIVYLHNNLNEDVVCSIAYYSSIGHFMGPAGDDPTTFAIPALSTIAFRPGCDDPALGFGSGGQETAIARAVPNRPTAAPVGLPYIEAVDKPKNGSIVIQWTQGGAQTVQGFLMQAQNADGTATGRVTTWGTLLPPGL